MTSQDFMWIVFFLMLIGIAILVAYSDGKRLFGPDSKMDIICKRCNYRNKLGTQYCRQCGKFIMQLSELHRNF